MTYSLKKRWRLLAKSQDEAQDLASRLGVSTVVGQLLVNRGVMDEAEARQFLSGGLENLHDPFLLKGMETAVERIVAALKSNEKITVYGDYDVDGITATALLYNTLREYHANIEYYIPERQSEGYGLNIDALERIAASGTNLLITVDCGISAWREVSAVSEMDMIITDHHQPPDTLPVVTAIINPKQPDCAYPDKNLAGVGVAFKLCQALRLSLDGQDAYTRYLDIVAVGTVADMVPLTGENRILVRYGLDMFRRTENKGLLAMLEVCDIRKEDVDSGKIGFVIAPRLNAAGRLTHAAAGVELLTSDDEQKVAQIAVELNLTNSERQEVERQILEKAEQSLQGIDWSKVKALVVSGNDWHPGVIGIVASRLVERYHRPTVMISVRDGIGKGSCRSIGSFDMYEGLRRCADLLVQFGGHHQAAGLSIKEEDIPRFQEKLNQVAGELLTEDDFIPVLSIDAIVSLREVNSGLVEQLACLAPYGMGNPSPLLACSPVELASSAAFGKDKRHLRLWVRADAVNSEVIAWNKGELAAEFDCRQSAEIAFVPEVHEWQGRRSIRMRAVDVRHIDKELPDKMTVGKMYLLLRGVSKSQGKSEFDIQDEMLRSLLQVHYAVPIDDAGIEFSLAVLAELGLVELRRQGNDNHVTVFPAPSQKLDIEASPTYRLRMEQIKSD